MHMLNRWGPVEGLWRDKEGQYLPCGKKRRLEEVAFMLGRISDASVAPIPSRLLMSTQCSYSGGEKVKIKIKSCQG